MAIHQMQQGVKYQAKLNGQAYGWVQTIDGLVKSTEYMNFKFFEVEQPRIKGEQQVAAVSHLAHNADKKMPPEYVMKRYEALGKVLVIS